MVRISSIIMYLVLDSTLTNAMVAMVTYATNANKAFRELIGGDGTALLDRPHSKHGDLLIPVVYSQLDEFKRQRNIIISNASLMHED
jgi:hypothetical protein